MQIFSRFFYLSLTFLAIIGGGCSTDVDVNADWKDVTIVYGLLNQHDSVHYIKINKAFLGDASATEMAQVRDSSEYAPGELYAYIIEHARDEGGQEFIQDSFLLESTVLSNKEPGTFYAPDQKVYYFTDSISQFNRYELKAVMYPGQQREKTVTAITEVINETNFTGIVLQKPDVSFSYKTGIPDLVVAWSTTGDGKRYQPSIVFNYINVMDSGEEIKDSIVWMLSEQVANSLSGGSKMETTIAGEEDMEFYRFLANNIPAKDEVEGLVARKTGHGNNDDIIFKLTVGGEELHNYIQVNEPSTSISQDPPEYTNVENGLGIFSARYHVRLAKPFDKATIEEISTASLNGLTGDLGFCPTHNCQ